MLYLLIKPLNYDHMSGVIKAISASMMQCFPSHKPLFRQYPYGCCASCADTNLLSNHILSLYGCQHTPILAKLQFFESFCISLCSKFLLSAFLKVSNNNRATVWMLGCLEIYCDRTKEIRQWQSICLEYARSCVPFPGCNNFRARLIVHWL